MLSLGNKTVFSLAALCVSLFVLSACSSISAGKPAGNFIPDFTSPRNSLASELGNGLVGQGMAQLSSTGREKALEAEYQALEYSQNRIPVSWQSSSDAASGAVIAATPYQVGSQNCRQYTHNFSIRGVPQTAKGTACRNSNGSWSLLN